MNRAEPTRNPSKAQASASDPHVNAWVSASAGSGKTRVLVHRVIRLMLAGTPPERILCLTFTRAAAATMENRLFEILGSWIALGNEDLQRRIQELTGSDDKAIDIAFARRLFARALESPGGLRIQTIHAFCERLLQRFPVEAGVVPSFDVMDERSSVELISYIRNAVLRDGGRNPDGPLGQALETLVAYVGVTDFDAVLREILSRRTLLMAFPQADGDGAETIIGHLCAGFGVPRGDTPEAVASAVNALMDRSALARALAALETSDKKTDLEQADRIALVLSAPDPQSAFEAMKRLVLKTDEKPKAETRLVTKAVRDREPWIHELLVGLSEEIEKLVMRERAIHLVAATRALFTLAGRIIALYEHEKAARGQYDYDDLIRRTLIMIRETPGAGWVLYKLDGGIDHILIDEAQDTSPEQWEIVQLIADEFFAGEGARSDAGLARSLFVVGDHKQSIYSFQGADPHIFDEMHRYFRGRSTHARQSFKDVPLSVSFRSVGDILDAVDAVFEQPEARDGLVPENGEYHLHEAFRRGQAGIVELWDLVTPDEREQPAPWEAPLDHPGRDSPRMKLAERIADTIAGWLRDGETLKSSGRPIRPGDILVLVRRRDQLADALIGALKKRAVPVAGADRLILTDHIAVMDLIALMRFVLMPEDDLSLACVLKSPLLARDDGTPINDNDLLGLCPLRQGSLWRELELHVENGAPYDRARQSLTRWLARADTMPPFAFLSMVLGADGGRRGVVARLGPEANDPLDELLQQALNYEHDHTPSLEGFVHWLVAAETVIKRDMEHTEDAVRVMTVHGAKGLEAEIVFLPDTCSPPRSQNDPAILLMPADGCGGGIPFWRVGSAYETEAVTVLREKAMAAQRREYNRLLYVAMTRARDRLYIAGYRGRTQSRETTWYDLVAGPLKQRAKEITAPDGFTVWRIEGEQVTDQEAGNVLTGAEEGTAREPLPDWTGRPAVRERAPFRMMAPSRLAIAQDGTPASETGISTDDQPPLSPTALIGDNDRFRRGRIVHKLLEVLPGLEPDRREEAARTYLARPSHDLDEEARSEILGEVMAILHDDRFAPLFGVDSLAEVDVAGFLPSTDIGELQGAIAGRIDRLAVTEDAVLIVDYKTNRSPPKAVEEVAPLYRRQLAAYWTVLRRVFPGRDVRAALLWTDGPRLMPVPPEHLETALPADGRD